MRKEMKNRNMEEANRLAEMEYQKGREAMGIPSESVNEEGEMHMTPSGKMTSMSPTDDDYEINYGADAVAEGYNEDDHGMGLEPGEEPVDESKIEKELNEMKRITNKLIG